MMDGGDSDHGLTRLRRMLVVFAQAPIAPLPGIRSLHYPTQRQGFECRLPFGTAHDLQPVGPAVDRQPVVQFVVVILAVGEDHPQPREVPAAHLSEEVLGSPGIVDVRRRHHHGDEKTQGIYEDMTLAALDLLAPVRAPFLALLGGLDRLAVDGGGAGRWCPPSFDAGQGAEGVEELLPSAVPVPPLEVIVDGFPRGQVVGQCPPGTTFASMVEQRVDDLAQLSLAGPATPVASAGSGQQRLDQSPLLVRHVAGIQLASHASFYAKPELWNRLSLIRSSSRGPIVREPGMDTRSKGRAWPRDGRLAQRPASWAVPAWDWSALRENVSVA